MPGPDPLGRPLTPLLCHCLRRLRYDAMCDRYECDEHGPRLTGEALYWGVERPVLEDRRG